MLMRVPPVEYSDTRPLFQQTWPIPKYPEVLLRLRKVANGIEECGPFPGLRWITETDHPLHRARPMDLENAAYEVGGIDGEDVGKYAKELVAGYLSSQLLPLEDGDGNPGYWYSAVGIMVIDPGKASYPSIRLTPKATEGILKAFQGYFAGQGEALAIVCPVTLPVTFLRQCGPGLARHILYTADVLQNSEKGLKAEDGPRVFARAINGVPAQFPPSTDVAELEKAGASREPCLPEHTHVLPFLVSLTRMGDPTAIKWASRLFRDSKDAAARKAQLLIQVATEVFGVSPAIFSDLEMDPDVTFLSGVPRFRPPK